MATGAPRERVTMIRARGVGFGFGPGEVLRGVDLDVAKGEFLALFGPNGAGKSTLLRVLAGELAPGRGEVALAGRPLASYGRRELARAVAVVPQETLSTFPYTVGELALMGRAPRVGRFALEDEADVAAARRALEALELWELRDRPVGEVSGGERQRAAIARTAPALRSAMREAYCAPRFTSCETARIVVPRSRWSERRRR